MEKTIYCDAYRLGIRVLVDARKRRRMDQTAVSKSLGKSKTWLGKIERYELRLDLLQTIKLCSVYGISAGALVRRIEKELS